MKRRTTSRLIALVLSLVLAISCLSGLTVSADAAATYVASVDKTELQRGDEFTLTVSLKGNTDLVSVFQIWLDVNADVFENATYVDEYGDEYLDIQQNPRKKVNQMIQGLYADLSDPQSPANKISCTGAAPTENDAIALDDWIFSVKLRVKDNAPAGSYSLKFLTSEEYPTSLGYYDLATDTQVPIAFNTQNAVVNVTIPPVPVESIEISDSAIDLQTGDSKKLSVSIYPEDASGSVEWSSNNEAVATVDAEGNVTAVAAGKATITAKVGDFTKTCEVTVTVRPVPLESIALSASSIDLEKGDSETLTVTYNPSNTTADKTVTWSSSDEKVATVKDGVVTAVKGGTAVITAKVGDKTATCNVVVNVSLKGITLNKSAVTLGKNVEETLVVKYDPEDVTVDKTVTWTSSNEKVATVDANGKVTTHTTGSAIITAKVGNYTATCTVKVEAVITDFTLSNAEATLNKGESIQLSVSNIIPDDTHESKNVTWTTSDAAVATVDATGKVTAVGGGHCVITAKVGSVEKSCAIEVTNKLTGIELSSAAETLLKGETATLTVKYLPEDTSDDKTVTWTSSDASIASVAGGVITAHKEGTAVITAKVGQFEQSCTVTVNEIHVESVTLNKTELALKVNDTAELTYTINPADTTDDLEAAVWSSSDEKVIIVDQNGNLKAIAAGTATITVEVNGKSAQCAVTVSDIAITGFSFKIDGKAFNASNTLNIKPKDVKKLTVSFLPENYTETPADVTFTSSDEAIVTVAADGTITGVADGKATIEVKMGELKASINVKVTTAGNDVTGDTFMMGLFIALAVLSAAGVAVIVAVKSRKAAKFNK